MRIFIVLILLFLSCCNMNEEVNTVDPQASANIKSSKENNLFIREYYLDKNKTTRLNVVEVWLEYCWMNKVIESTSRKVKTSGIQINFKISDFNSSDINEDKYFIDWRMEVQNIGILGRGNNVYTLYINSEIIPDKLKIMIKKRIDGKFVDLESFMIHSK